MLARMPRLNRGIALRPFQLDPGFAVNQSATFLVVAIVVGLLTGCLLGTQPSINGALGGAVKYPLQASLISFITGTSLLLVLTIVSGQFPPAFVKPPSELPWWIWFGGAVGVVMVSTSLFFVPRIGSLWWFAAVMTGQTITALFLDHFGLLGNPRSPINGLRILGVVLLLLGVFSIVGAKYLEYKHTHPALQSDEQASKALDDESGLGSE